MRHYPIFGSFNGFEARIVPATGFRQQKSISAPGLSSLVNAASRVQRARVVAETLAFEDDHQPVRHLHAPGDRQRRDRVGSAMSVLGQNLFLARRFDEAVAKLLLAIQEDASYPQPYRILAACYAQMGRLEDARETVARLRTIAPVVMPDLRYLRNPARGEMSLSGLARGKDWVAAHASPSAPAASTRDRVRSSPHRDAHQPRPATVKLP